MIRAIAWGVAFVTIVLVSAAIGHALVGLIMHLMPG